MRKKGVAGLIFMIFFVLAHAQQVRVLTVGRPVSLRGLSVPGDRVVWVSGSSGTVGISRDWGSSWKWTTVKGYEKTDFRDIWAFNEKEAVIMGITKPAVILKTKDGGKTWTRSFMDSSESAFLDAMDFVGDQGIVTGDPQEGDILFAETTNRGKTWMLKNPSGFDTAAAGESFFAASGSNCLIQKTPLGKTPFRYILVSGGKKSGLFISDGRYHTVRYPLNLNQGGETTGANSIAINPANPDEAYVVGGDFSHDTSRYGNSLRISLSNFSQTPPLDPPHGYRSCVEYIDNQVMICCGTSGVDISTDGGTHWRLISAKSFHVCRASKNGKMVFLAGPGGTVAKLEQ